MKLPQIVLVLLCAIVTASASHAATRVFYDGSESGNANLWNQVDLRDKCVSVTSSADGVAGPYSGSRMFRCNSNGTANWSATNSYETMAIPPFSMNNEVLYRVRVRLDQNFDRTSGSPKKIFRIFGSLEHVQNFESTFAGNSGFVWGTYVNNIQSPNYWGWANGDTTMNSSSWHTLEYYYNKTTGNVKVWHDHVLVFEQTFGPITGSVGEDGIVHLTSNFSDDHDATNYIYFDDIEVFTDSANGTPATGSMADASISSSAGSTLSPPVITDIKVN